MRKRITSGIAVLAAVIMAMTLTAGPANAAPQPSEQAPAPGSSQTADVAPLSSSISSSSGTLRIPCGAPPIAGQAVLTWKKGTLTTTVHYNNPCMRIFYAEVVVTNFGSDTIHCMTVPANKVGSRKFEHNVLGNIKRIRQGC